VGGEETSRWVYSKMGRGELNEAEERRAKRGRGEERLP
jgi:hypothetical protein